MLDFVEAQIETGQVGQIVEVLDVTDQVIVEIEFGERAGNLTREVDFLNLILAKAYSLHIIKVNGETSRRILMSRTSTFVNRSKRSAGMDWMRQ